MTDELELATRADFADLQQGHWGLPDKWRTCGNEGTFTADGGQGSESSVSYGCFEGSPNNPRPAYVADEKCMWWMSNYASGSHYSGGSVCESNYRVLVRECEQVNADQGWTTDTQTFWQVFHGGHGTYAIAFHVDKTPRVIFDLLCALEQYPILNEQDHSELECEQQDEAWENWARSDYRRALEKEFCGEADEVSDEDLFEHFHAWAEKANEYWEDQNGEGQYIDVDAIAKAADEPPPGFVFDPEEPDMPEENLSAEREL